MKTKNRIFLIIAYILLLAPLAYAVVLSFPTYDDFDLYYYMNGHFSVAEGYRRTVWMWKGWTGDWLATFLQMTLNPLLFFSYKSLGYGIEMLVFVALFVAALIFFAYTIMNVVCGIEDRVHLWWAIFAFITPFIVGFAYYEVYSWFDGFCYGMYMGFFLMAVAFIIRYFYHATRVNLIMATLFGCLNCINLPTCVPIGIIYLYIWWNEPMDRGKRRIRHLVPLMLFIAAAFTNVLAPGNFGRQNTSGIESGIGKALLYAGYYCVRRALKVITNWPVLVGLIILLLLGIYIGKECTSEVLHPLRLLIIQFIGIYGAIFPVALGYGSWVMPNRIDFVFDCLFLMSLGTVLFITGQFMGELELLGKKKGYGYVLTFVIVAGIIVLFSAKNSPWTTVVTNPKSLIEDRVANLMILCDLEESQEAEPVITASPIPSSGMYSYIGIREDGEWPNGTIAYYFNKDNVRIEWTD